MRPLCFCGRFPAVVTLKISLLCPSAIRPSYTLTHITNTTSPPPPRRPCPCNCRCTNSDTRLLPDSPSTVCVLCVVRCLCVDTSRPPPSQFRRARLLHIAVYHRDQQSDVRTRPLIFGCDRTQWQTSTITRPAGRPLRLLSRPPRCSSSNSNSNSRRLRRRRPAAPWACPP
jgi:hypothetical protein